MEVVRRWQGCDTLQTVCVMADTENSDGSETPSVNTIGGLCVGNTRFKGKASSRRAACGEFWTDLRALLPESGGRLLLFMCKGGQDTQGFKRLNDDFVGRLSTRSLVEAHVNLNLTPNRDVVHDNLQVAVIPRAPSLPPNSLTGACSSILDPAVFYLWVDGSARGFGRAMAAATSEFNESLGAGVDVICTGILDIEVAETVKASGLGICSAKPTANKMAWKMCEFHLDSSGQLQWVHFGSSPGADRSGGDMNRLPLASDGSAVVQEHDDDAGEWKTKYGQVTASQRKAAQSATAGHSPNKKKESVPPLNVFSLTSGNRTLMLQAPSLADRRRWVEVLVSELRQRDLKHPSFRASAQAVLMTKGLRASSGGSVNSNSPAARVTALSMHTPAGGQPLTLSPAMSDPMSGPMSGAL